MNDPRSLFNAVHYSYKLKFKLFFSAAANLAFCGQRNRIPNLWKRAMLITRLFNATF